MALNEQLRRRIGFQGRANGFDLGILGGLDDGAVELEMYSLSSQRIAILDEVIEIKISGIAAASRDGRRARLETTRSVILPGNFAGAVAGQFGELSGVFSAAAGAGSQDYSCEEQMGKFGK